jgi:polar amino acid transport system ATP-binding protein
VKSFTADVPHGFAVKNVERGLTLIVVTHELGFARGVADEVAFMDHGKTVETGAPEELFYAPQSVRLQRFLSRVW